MIAKTSCSIVRTPRCASRGRILARSNDPREAFGKLADKAYLDLAAKKFALGAFSASSNSHWI